MIDLKEIKVQEAIGSARKGNELAVLIRATDDPKAILWASRHKYAAVRAAAAKSPLVPFSQLLRLYFCDSSSMVKEACRGSIAERQQEFEQLLEVMEEFPQLNLQLYDRKGSYDFVDTMEEEGYAAEMRPTEMALQEPDFNIKEKKK